MLKFNILGVDGEWEKEFTTFDEFKEWFGPINSSGLAELKTFGSIVTPMGTERLIPIGEETMKHIDGLLLLEKKGYEGRDFYSKMGLDTKAIDESIVQKLLGNKDYSDHELGRVFRIAEYNESSALIGKLVSQHPESPAKRIVDGSIGLQDVVVIRDVLKKDMLVIDLRSEAESILDLLPRKQVMSFVFSAEDSRYEGFDDDGGPWNHIQVSGDPEAVTKMENLLDTENEEHLPDRIHINRAGFRNTPLYRHDLYEILTHDVSFYARKYDIREMISIARLDKKAIRNAGFTGNTVTMEQDGEMIEFKLGQIFRINDIALGPGTLTPITASEVKDYKKLSEFEAHERCPF